MVRDQTKTKPPIMRHSRALTFYAPEEWARWAEESPGEALARGVAGLFMFGGAKPEQLAWRRRDPSSDCVALKSDFGRVGNDFSRAVVRVVGLQEESSELKRGAIAAVRFVDLRRQA